MKTTQSINLQTWVAQWNSLMEASKTRPSSQIDGDKHLVDLILIQEGTLGPPSLFKSSWAAPMPHTRQPAETASPSDRRPWPVARKEAAAHGRSTTRTGYDTTRRRRGRRQGAPRSKRSMVKPRCDLSPPTVVGQAQADGTYTTTPTINITHGLPNLYYHDPHHSVI
jgi:hypothetical protein